MGKTDSYRILAKDKLINNDTWITGQNNNDVIIGLSGQECGSKSACNKL